MSRVIDNRVVQMEFDNARFERNVSQSLSTLDKLKNALSFRGSEKDIGAVERAFGGLGKSLTAFEQIGIGALRNFGSSLESWAASIIMELSGINNVINGFSKFDQITKSAATLNAQGFAMEEVNKQLARLNWFTDETSYNLTDMVDNISKFTATGQGLEDSTDAMMGIALWAATAGQNAGTASRAMYQLSQAMSGYMRKEDWKSIQNANMDMKEFRELALETGVRLGKLTKNADGLYKSLNPKNKSGGEWFSVTQFADYLTEGAWFTSDVMMEVYRSYTKAANDIHDYIEEHSGATVRDAIEALGDTLDAFSLKAFKAGQEARTWGDAVDSVKDALSTKWMGIFQYIFGNSEKATVFFTNLANTFYDMFVEPMSGLVESFRLWDNAFGRSKWQDAAISALESVNAVAVSVQTTFDRFVFGEKAEELRKHARAVQKYYDTIGLAPGETGEDALLVQPGSDGINEARASMLMSFTNKLAEMSDRFKNAVEDLDIFETILRGVLSLFGIGKEVVSGFLQAIKPFSGILTGSIKVLAGWASELSKRLEDGYKKIKANNTFYKIFSVLLKPLVTLKNNIKAFYELFMPRFLDAWERVKNKLKPVTERFSKLSDSAGGLLDRIKSKWENLFTNFDAEKAVDKVFRALTKVKELVYAIVGVQDGDAFVSWLTKKLDSGIAAFDRFKENASKTVKGLLESIKTYFSEAVQWISDHWDEIKQNAHNVFGAIGGFFEGLWNAVTGFFKNEDGTDGFQSFVQTFKDLGEVLGKVVSYIIAGLKPLADGLKNTLESLSLDNAGEFLEGGGIALLGAALYKWAKDFKKSSWLSAFKEVLEGIGGVLDGFTHLLDAKALKEAAIGIGVLVGSLLLLISMPQDKLISAATVLSVVVTILAQSLKKLSSFTSGIKINKEGLSGSKSGAGGTLLSAAFAILILAGAIRLIANVPQNDLYRAATVILALVVVVGMMLKAIGRIVAGDGDTDVKKVFNGINSGNMGNNNAIIKFGGPVMTILAFALLVATVMKASEKLAQLAKDNSEGLIWAISIIGGLLVAMTVALFAISKFSKESETTKVSNSTWKTILAMAAGIYLVALAFAKIATVDRTTAGPARMAGTAVFIIGIIGMFTLLAAYTKGSKFSGMGNFAKGILAITAAVAVLAVLFKMLAELPSTAQFGSAIGAFIVLGVILGALLYESSRLTKTEKAAIRLQKVAVALIGMSAALAIAAGALIVLSEIDGNKIGTALVAILLALGALAGIGAIGKYLGNGLLAVGQFILMIAGAVALAAVGFLACAEAIKIFSDSTLDMKKVGRNMLDFVNEILKNVGPTITWFLTAALESVLAIIPAAFIAIVDTLNTTLQNLLVDNKLEQLVNSVCDIVIVVVNTVTARSEELIYAFAGLFLAVLRGLGDWANEHSEEVSEALRNCIEGVIKVILDLFSPLGEKLFGETWGEEGGLKDRIQHDFVPWAEGVFLIWFATKFIGGMIASVGALGVSITTVIGLFGALMQMYSTAMPAIALDAVSDSAVEAALGEQGKRKELAKKLGVHEATIDALRGAGVSFESIENKDSPFYSIVQGTIGDLEKFQSKIVVADDSASANSASWIPSISDTIDAVNKNYSKTMNSQKSREKNSSFAYVNQIGVVPTPTAVDILRAQDSGLAKFKNLVGVNSGLSFDLNSIDYEALLGLIGGSK